MGIAKLRNLRILGGITMPTGNTAARPASPQTGTIFYNTQTSQMEVYNGSAWAAINSSQATLTTPTAVDRLRFDVGAVGSPSDGELGVVDGSTVDYEGTFYARSSLFDFRGTDASSQFRVGYTPSSQNFFLAVGGASSSQPAVLVAQSDTNEDVDGSVMAGGIGTLYLGGGGGHYLALKPAVSGNVATNYLTIRPAENNVDPIISSSRGMIFDTDTNSTSIQHTFKIGGATMAVIRSPLAPASSDRWWEFSSDGTSGFARFEATGTASAVNGFIRSKGNSQLAFWNGNGGMVTMTTVDNNTTANTLILRSAKTATDPVVETSGETNTGLTVRASGTGILSLGRSTGGVKNVGATLVQTQRVAATNGGTATISNATRVLFLVAGGSVTGFTVTLPTALADGHVFTISTNVTVSSLTLTAPVGTIQGSATSVGATAPASYVWNNTDSSWYRI